MPILYLILMVIERFLIQNVKKNKGILFIIVHVSDIVDLRVLTWHQRKNVNTI